jgi:16S rRNA (adenine1518-N6/adenine1519-N6)-dimethyltransferase
MVQLAGLREREHVMEIGTGKGIVTRELCSLASSVEAFEIDVENYRATRRLKLENLILRNEDAFAMPRQFDVLVSSLPYSESSRFVEWIASLRFRRAVLLLQKDFAEKLIAVPGQDSYRAISVISQISTSVNVTGHVGKGSFQPAPKVSSVLVTVEPRRELSSQEIGVIKMLFSQRRRKLGSALKNLGLSLPYADAEMLSRRVEGMAAHEFESLLKEVHSL